MKKFIGKLGALIVAIFIVGFVLGNHFGFAHPGRLNSEGCHNVHKDWEYKDGRVVKAGTYHCHRLLGAMRLDGLEMLQDPNDPGKEKETKAETETWLDWLRSFFNGG